MKKLRAGELSKVRKPAPMPALHLLCLPSYHPQFSLHSLTQVPPRNKGAVTPSPGKAQPHGLYKQGEPGSPKRLKCIFLGVSYHLHRCDQLPLKLKAIRAYVASHTPPALLSAPHSHTDLEGNNGCLACLKATLVVTLSLSETLPEHLKCPGRVALGERTHA